MEVKVKSNIKKAIRDIGNVPKKYVQKAMVTALNKVGAEVVTQAKRELKDATGLKAGVVAKKIKKDRSTSRCFITTRVSSSRYGENI